MLKRALLWAFLFVAATVLMHWAIVMWMGGGQYIQEPDLSFAPPGYAIGIIWSVLFAGMGAAFGILRYLERPCQARTVFVFALLCLAYPVYTDNFANRYLGQIGAILSLNIAWIAMVRALCVSKRAALCLLPSVLWLSYAIFIITALVGEYGWFVQSN